MLRLAFAIIGLATYANALAIGVTPCGSAVTHGARMAPAVMMAKTVTKKLVSVILDEEVEGVGSKGVVVQVKSSYAENVIVRGGKGRIATASDLAEIAAKEAAAAAEAAAAKSKAEATKKTIQDKFGRGMKFEVQPDEVVTSETVAAEIVRATKVEVAADAVEMPDIAECPGSAVAEVRLHADVKATIKVNVEKSKITFS